MTAQEYTDILSERISDCIAHGYDYAPIIERGKDDYISAKITEMIYHSIWKRKDISIAQLIEHQFQIAFGKICSCVHFIFFGARLPQCDKPYKLSTLNSQLNYRF